jgi:fused signal recognition particle receptor
MFSFFKKKITGQPATDTANDHAVAPSSANTPASTATGEATSVTATITTAMPAERPRASWLARLGTGLRRTGQSISTVFTGTKIDDDL